MKLKITDWQLRQMLESTLEARSVHRWTHSAPAILDVARLLLMKPLFIRI